MAGESKRSRERSQRVGVVIDEQQVSFAWQMNVLCGGASVGGGQGEARGRLSLGWGFLRPGRRMLGLSLRQLDAKRCAAPFVAQNGNGSVMIADDRLNDRQTQASSLHFCRVVRRKKPGTFFRRKSLAGVRHFDSNVVLVLGSAHGQRATGG